MAPVHIKLAGTFSDVILLTGLQKQETVHKYYKKGIAEPTQISGIHTINIFPLQFTTSFIISIFV